MTELSPTARSGLEQGDSLPVLPPAVRPPGRLPAAGRGSRRREFCHSADTPSPSLLKHLLKGEGGAAE